MRYLALLAAVYALAAALVVPSTLFAQEAGEAPALAPAEPAPVEPAPARPDPAPAAPGEPAPAPTEPAPAPPEPAPAPPEPVVLDDERDEPKATPKAVAAASGTVTIVDFSFTPGTITIDQGDTVTWRNNGPTPHSATAPNGAFDTGIFAAGESRSHTFDEAGTFSYICTPHPNMRGTVVVRASQSGGGDPSGSGAADTGGSASGGTTGDAAQSDPGPTLPNSGADAGVLVLLGGLMLMLGAAVHRRTRPDQPHAAGRIGW